jgi:hypothetical protein
MLEYDLVVRAGSPVLILDDDWKLTVIWHAYIGSGERELARADGISL